METSKSDVIFSQKFPDAYPETILKKAEELSRAVPDGLKKPPPPFQELLKRFEESETYEPKPGAETQSEAFISLAIAVCREFEIDTEITKGNYEVKVTMDLDYGWYDSAFKRPFAAVLNHADDFNLTCHPDRPDCVRLSMTYYTHIRYVYGEKVDW